MKKVNFGFAFNQKDFSDRVLHLQITPKETESPYHYHTREQNPKSSVHISTLVLAAHSPFFYKLFHNDLKESAQKDATLMINSTEELDALMDVLSFIYKNTLKATTSSELLAVLMAADKFEVTCCMEYCIQALLKLPISPDLAVLYVDLPPSLLTSEVVQPLIDASRKVLAAEYMDFAKSQEKAMQLPLSAIKFVLTTDGLRVSSEDDVFEFIMKWAHAHYPNAEELQETLTKHLWPLVHFQYMSNLKLKELYTCTDIEPKLVLDALMAKLDSPYGQHLHSSEGSLGRRSYIFPLVKVVQLDFPPLRCAVYLNLRRDECAGLLQSKRLHSQNFVIGGESFSLSIACNEEPKAFALNLKGSSNVDLEFAVMRKPSHEFQAMVRAKRQKLGEGGLGSPNLLQISWAEFMSNDCDYFINDILRLRITITLNNSI